MQRQAQIEDRDIDARLVGQGRGDAEQRLGGTVLGPRDQRVGFLAGLDPRQSCLRELLEPAFGRVFRIERRRVVLASIALQEAAIGIDHARRRAGAHHAAVRGIGDLRVADKLGQQREMEHRERIRAALRPDRRDVGNRRRLVARPAAAQPSSSATVSEVNGPLADSATCARAPA